MRYEVMFFESSPSLSLQEEAIQKWLDENKNIIIHTISDDFTRILYSKEKKK